VHADDGRVHAALTRKPSPLGAQRQECDALAGNEGLRTGAAFFQWRSLARFGAAKAAPCDPRAPRGASAPTSAPLLPTGRGLFIWSAASCHKEVAVPLCLDKINHAHHAWSVSPILDRFHLALGAGPHLSLGCLKLVTAAIVDVEIPFDRMADHVVGH
jgi:hypothetical protein